MKKIFIAILINPLFFFSQTNPIDTSYYKNGSIRSIFYKNDYIITGYLSEVFYLQSNCKKCIGRRIADTVYTNQPSWVIPQNIVELNRDMFVFSRKYFFDNIILEKNVPTDGFIPFEALRIDKRVLALSRRRKYDKFEDIYITLEDSLKNYTNKKIFAHINLNGGPFPIHQEFSIDSGYIEINAYENGSIKNIILKDVNQWWNGKHIEFYTNETLKELGYYEKGGKIGIWQEWYDNEQLKTIGSYSGYSKDNNGVITQLKDTEWKYYDSNGKLIKIEMWDNGKLLKTDIPKNINPKGSKK